MSVPDYTTPVTLANAADWDSTDFNNTFRDSLDFMKQKRTEWASVQQESGLGFTNNGFISVGGSATIYVPVNAVVLLEAYFCCDVNATLTFSFRFYNQTKSAVPTMLSPVLTTLTTYPDNNMRFLMFGMDKPETSVAGNNVYRIQADSTSGITGGTMSMLMFTASLK